MIRPLISIAFGALAWAAVADLREPPASQTNRFAFAEACRHYEARAAAARPGEFVGFLAEACSRAESLLESGTPEQRGRSTLLLYRIAELRGTVARMNLARASRDAYRYVPVSPSGEFLIAHRLGLMLAFDAWLDTGVEFSVASYP